MGKTLCWLLWNHTPNGQKCWRRIPRQLPKTVTVLRERFARYRLPEQVVTDNGPQFTSSEFSQFLAANGVSTSVVALSLFIE